jgi:tetratricopeptide (TPR) repeat protein
MSKPTVFVSYSRSDRKWKDELVRHLEVLEREGLLDVWDDSRIPVSTDWLPEIEGAIARAQVAVLLVSVDFLGSDFIRKKEVPEFLARRKAEGLHVFPVIVRPCTWDQVEELASIQARPRDGKVLTDFRGSRAERELVEIAREILRLAEAAPSASKTVPSPSAALLHQLPAPPADFVGRAEDLAALRASVKKGGATICGLQGQGGVGKTALALVLAHEMTPNFPDAQIFLDLQGMSERPLSTTEAMAQVVRSFLPEAKVPEGNQLAAVFRNALAGKRALLLMDNASGPDQVAPLVPPSGCALLVTSRRRFTLPGLAVRDLGLLPEKDACALLLAIASRIAHRAGEIALLSGYLPFALRIAASTLVERPDLSVEAYEKRLGGKKERAAIGEKVLGLSYSLLPDAFQQRYRHLAVFAGDFDAPASMAVWGLSEEETDETLGAFVRGSLLEGKDGRYKLHDLARAFAASRLTEEERAQGELRHAEHYSGVLGEADRLYEQGNEHLLAGFALFDRERHQIAAGQAWAKKNLQVREEAARLASKYPNAGAYVLSLRLTPRQLIGWLESGREGARRGKDRAAEGRHLGNFGLACADLGETRRALEYYEQSLAVLREIGDRRGEGNALGNLGNAYYLLGETRRAIDYYEQQLAITREIGHQRGEGNALGCLGLAYADLSETQRAIEYHEQYLAIARELGDRRGEGNALGNLGNTYYALGETRRAIEHYEQRLVIARGIGDRRGEGNTSWNLGEVYETLGELDRAVELMQVCVDFERELGHPDAEKDAAYVEAIRARLVGG